MEAYICLNCGVQYEPSESEPALCKICLDDRQYVPQSGQKWTTLQQFQQGDFQNVFTKVESNLYRIKTVPQVGIGQNAYLVTTDYGIYLWDCITYIDQETIKTIKELGGLDGIILSHPHYYSTIVEWAKEFDCSIYIHEADQEWVTRSSQRYVFWQGKALNLTPELTILNLGGHFEGSSVLHWRKGAEGQGVLLVGDTIFIVPDQGWISFLYSHPNRIPLPSFEVTRITECLSRFEFEHIYGAFDQSIKSQGKEAVMKSALRYLYHVDRTEPIKKQA